MALIAMFLLLLLSLAAITHTTVNTSGAKAGTREQPARLPHPAGHPPTAPRKLSCRPLTSVLRGGPFLPCGSRFENLPVFPDTL